ncbi:UDP-xylose and UDP-N-acetylglucosamine transporter-like [Rhodnius prolixus]|uniref:Putative udp-n-acetylglucosamine transporter n=1 Tax=Rhodnius prolixus TaxID=13249 RepID=R4FKK8_RHOPR
MSVVLGICGVFVGCILNAVCLEFSVKADPGCGTLITFAQFSFIAVEGFLITSRCGTKPRNIPIKNYLIIVVVFFVCNVCNNFAFDFNISMPLHMIFRSGSLFTNMLMSIWVLKKKYPLSKFVSVGLITAGVIICTVVTGKNLESSSKGEEPSKDDPLQKTDQNNGFILWLLGIALLIFALFVSALLGVFQETLYKKYGKHPYEALYYIHMLSLPIFLPFFNNLKKHYNIMMESAPLLLPWLNIHAPCMLIYLIGNMVSQYLCISSVYLLTTEASSLTVTLVITLRKFLSLLLSIVYFGNEFTIWHWVGTILVFVGTLIFTEVPSKSYIQFKEKLS